MRRVGCGKRGPRLHVHGNAFGIHFERAPLYVGFVEQVGRRVVDEIRIAEILGTIGENALLDFRHEMHVLCRVVRHVGEVV